MNYKDNANEQIPDDYEDQHYVLYQLTRMDYLALYAFMTPQEIIDEFHAGRCCSISTIYRHYGACGLTRPLKAKTWLKKVVAAALPDDYEYDEWESVSSELIEAAKAKTIAKIHKKSCKHESLFD